MAQKLRDEQGGQAWAQWVRQLVRLAATCKGLHEALLGPASGALFQALEFHASHAGLSQVRCAG